MHPETQPGSCGDTFRQASPVRAVIRWRESIALDPLALFGGPLLGRYRKDVFQPQHGPHRSTSEVDAAARSGAVIPLMHRPRVVFPHPLSPTRPNVSPVGGSRADTPSTAFTWPTTFWSTPSLIGKCFSTSMSGHHRLDRPPIPRAPATGPAPKSPGPPFVGGQASSGPNAELGGLVVDVTGDSVLRSRGAGNVGSTSRAHAGRIAGTGCGTGRKVGGRSTRGRCLRSRRARLARSSTTGPPPSGSWCRGGAAVGTRRQCGPISAILPGVHDGDPVADLAHQG